MTSPSDNDAIQINLQIKIPFRGQPIEINESGQVSRVSSTNYLKTNGDGENLDLDTPPLRLLSVLLPGPGSTYPVNPIGSGRTEFVARGRISGGSPPPNEVRLSCGGGVVSTIPHPTTGEWYHAAVPGAECTSSAPHPSNTLLVEYYRNGNYQSNETVQFFGICNSSLSGSPSSSARPTTFLPISYQVKVDGFNKALECFNGIWNLRLIPCSAGSDLIHWRVELPTNDGSIEFIGNTSNESAELLFVKGAAEIRYSKPASSWIPMNIAEFADCTCRSLTPGVSIPAIVQVEPA
jgi:hypothetical protein